MQWAVHAEGRSAPRFCTTCHHDLGLARGNQAHAEGDGI
jgi:hypothetical protein